MPGCEREHLDDGLTMDVIGPVAERVMAVHSIDGDGLWVRCYSPWGAEVELTITGLTPEVLLKALARRV